MNSQPRPRLNSVSLRLERIRNLLAERPMTARELAAALHVDVRNIYIYRDRLAGEIRIASWRRSNGGAPAPVYALGFGPDAKRISPIAKKVHARAWRQRIKRTDPSKYEDMLAAARARATRNNPRQARRDPAAVAIFGAPQ